MIYMLNSKKLIVLDPAGGGSRLGFMHGEHSEAAVTRALILKLKDKLLMDGKVDAKTSFELAGKELNCEWPDIVRWSELKELNKADIIDFFIRLHINGSSSEAKKGIRICYAGSLFPSIAMHDALVSRAQEENYSLDGGMGYNQQYIQTAPMLKLLSRELVIVPGFLSNPTDREILTGERGQKMLAEGMANGIYKILEIKTE